MEGPGLLLWEVEKAEAIKVPLGLAHPPCSQSRIMLGLVRASCQGAPPASPLNLPGQLTQLSSGTA